MRGINLKVDPEKEVELEKGETVVNISGIDDGGKFRAAIFGTLGILDFEPRNDIILDEDEMATVREEVLPNFPDLWMHDFYNPKVPGGIQIVTQRNRTKEKAMSEIRRSPDSEKPVRAYSILNPHALPDRDWDHFNRMQTKARQLAKKVGVEFVQKGQYHFFYNDQVIDWRNGGKEIITEEDLRNWKEQVDLGEFNEDDEAMTG